MKAMSLYCSLMSPHGARDGISCFIVALPGLNSLTFCLKIRLIVVDSI